MKPSDALSKDARALLRAARGGDDISTAERQRVLQAFQERAASDDTVADSAASTPRRHSARATRSRPRRKLPRPMRHAAWALAAVISTGSLAALARDGAFSGWRAAIEKVLGTLTGERSTQGQEAAVKRPAARRDVPALGEPETKAPEPAVMHEPEPDDDTTRPAVADTETARLPRTHEPADSSRAHARAATREPSPSRTKSAAPDPSASAELDLIVMARNALAARQHAEARAAAERHALRFPAGAFAEEREAILALCACRETGARESARAFIERRPDSLFAERIRRDCKLGTNLVPGASATGTHQESPPRSGAQ